MTVNDVTRKLVRERAKYFCKYCHSLEEASAAVFAIGIQRKKTHGLKASFSKE